MPVLAQMSPQLPELPQGPDLQNLRGPIEIPAYSTTQVTLFAVACILLTLLTIWLLYQLLKRQKPQTPQSPYQAFRTEIQTIRSSGDINPDQAQKALRSYLLAICESEKSGAHTGELIALAARHPAIKSANIEQIERTLQQLDQARFQGLAEVATQDPTQFLSELSVIVENIETEQSKLNSQRKEPSPT